MRRVLVPLDGTPLAASILPDARRLAGPSGELILIRDMCSTHLRGTTHSSEEREAVETCREYLLAVADNLSKDGVRVQVQPMVIGDAALAIDEAATIFKAGMIAAATHGRNLAQRLFRGSVAWNALAHSPVPVLLRHATLDEVISPPHPPARRRMLVPLDGSPLAEKAVPIARQLAAEWNAVTELVEVIQDPYLAVAPYGPVAFPPYSDQEDVVAEARSRLLTHAATFQRDAYTRTLIGPAVERLTGVVEQDLITDIVIASHGLTGLSRVILGSVTDALIERLHIPIIVVPALAAGKVQSVDEEPVESFVSQTVAEPAVAGEPW
jgi:nucleotide-binding universal stress UspA family protein